MRNEIITKIKVKEKSITLEDLKAAKEVIVTNGLMGAMSVRKIDNVIFDSFKFSHIFNNELKG